MQYTKEVHLNYHRAWRRFWRRIRETIGCEHCGRRFPGDELSFHHRDPRTKAFKVSSYCGGPPTEKIWQEIMKCDCVCPSCHILAHKAERIDETVLTPEIDWRTYVRCPRKRVADHRPDVPAPEGGAR